MYSTDRRLLAAHVYSLLGSLRKTAKILQVSHSSVHRWLNNPARKPYDSTRRRQQCKAAVVAETIRAAVRSNPLLSCRKLVQIILDTLCIRVSAEIARSVIKQSGLTRKKARFFGSPPDLEVKTQQFLDARRDFLQQGFKIWSLDETGFGRNGAPMYGYAPRGKQLRIKRRPARVTTQSALVIADDEGTLIRECRAGSFNTASFVHFLTRLELPRDSVILLDNVAFHKSRDAARVAAERGWHFLFVPPYSHWFNPIEGIFSIVKRAWYAGSTSSRR